MPPSPSSRAPAHWIRPVAGPARRGHRAGALADSQLLCGVGPYELDVLVREMEGPHGLELLGQLTRADGLHVPAVEVPLTLVTADEARAVSQTTSDAFGEFGFERQPTALYGLRVGAGEDAPCVLVWEEAS